MQQYLLNFSCYANTKRLLDTTPRRTAFLDGIRFWFLKIRLLMGELVKHVCLYARLKIIQVGCLDLAPAHLPAGGRNPPHRQPDLQIHRRELSSQIVEFIVELMRERMLNSANTHVQSFNLHDSSHNSTPELPHPCDLSARCLRDEVVQTLPCCWP